MERLHHHNVPAARRLRVEQTHSEALLWARLRDRQLGGLKFRRQHPVGAFVLDFYCASVKVAVEIDGGIHRCPEVASADRDREEILRGVGIRFLRVQAEDVEQRIEYVLRDILEAATTS